MYLPSKLELFYTGNEFKLLAVNLRNLDIKNLHYITCYFFYVYNPGGSLRQIVHHGGVHWRKRAQCWTISLLWEYCTKTIHQSHTMHSSDSPSWLALHLTQYGVRWTLLLELLFHRSTYIICFISDTLLELTTMWHVTWIFMVIPWIDRWFSWLSHE